MFQEWMGVGDMVISDMNVHILKRGMEVCINILNRVVSLYPQISITKL